MTEEMYEVPICDVNSKIRKIIFHVLVNENGEVKEYMTKNIRDYRSVTEQEMRVQINEYLKKLYNG